GESVVRALQDPTAFQQLRDSEECHRECCSKERRRAGWLFPHRSIDTPCLPADWSALLPYEKQTADPPTRARARFEYRYRRFPCLDPPGRNGATPAWRDRCR